MKSPKKWKILHRFNHCYHILKSEYIQHSSHGDFIKMLQIEEPVSEELWHQYSKVCCQCGKQKEALYSGHCRRGADCECWRR